MALAWRLTDPRFAGDLEGSGNRLYGARWNSPGRGVVYCSENLSLCVLENLVHLAPAMRRRLPPRLALRIEYPEKAKAVKIASLPEARRTAECRTIGDRWLDDGHALLLQAPSFVVPQEMNVLFNPAHPMMQEVRVVETFAFVMDERLRAD